MSDELENDPIAKCFIEFYRNFYWRNETGSSGPNSDYELTYQLRANLEAFFKEYSISSICDVGCGDANLFYYMNLPPMDYLGIDCVPEMITACQERFKEKPQFQFMLANLLKVKLPKVDLLLSRDVVHYLPNDLIFQFLKQCQVSGSKYLLITHNPLRW